MNFLAHHAVARRVHSDAPAEFYAGNVLPDLLAMSGDGRLRAHHLAAPSGDDPLIAGMRLHLETDRRFHGDPTFVSLQTAASTRLTALIPPLPRRFFFTHIAVELALDGVLIRRDDALDDDLYDCLDTCGAEALAQRAAVVLGRERLPHLAHTLTRFVARRWLENVRTHDGVAEGLLRIGRSAGLDTAGADPAAVARIVAGVAADVQPHAENLLRRAGGLW